MTAELHETSNWQSSFTLSNSPMCEGRPFKVTCLLWDAFQAPPLQGWHAHHRPHLPPCRRVR